MKKIILASASPQRKKLFNLLGVPFTVEPSRVKEAKKIRTNCCALVKENALLKAKDIAARHKSDPEALEKIMKTIRLGGGGYWGAIPMPPHPQLKNEDISAALEYSAEALKKELIYAL